MVPTVRLPLSVCCISFFLSSSNCLLIPRVVFVSKCYLIRFENRCFAFFFIVNVFIILFPSRSVLFFLSFMRASLTGMQLLNMRKVTFPEKSDGIADGKLNVASPSRWRANIRLPGDISLDWCTWVWYVYVSSSTNISSYAGSGVHNAVSRRILFWCFLWPVLLSVHGMPWLSRASFWGFCIPFWKTYSQIESYRCLRESWGIW